MKRRLLTVLLTVVMLLPGAAFGTVTPVTAGTDAISAALLAAAAGDTLELTTSGGVYNETAITVIDAAVTIRAADGLAARPIWTSNASVDQIKLAADLTLDGIIFDGSANDSLTENCIRIDPANSEGIDLRVNYCVIKNFNDGVAGDEDGHGIKGSAGTKMDSIVVTNTRFMHMPGEHISFKDEEAAIAPGSVKYLRVEYCTFWDGGNEAIYIQANDEVALGTPDPEVIINHVTAVDMGSKVLYPNLCDNAIIKNSIVAYSAEYSNRLYGENSVLSNHLYYQCPKGIDLKDGATYDGDLALEEQNPYFADYEGGDFAVAANSPAALFADDSTALGDTSWGTWDAAAITNWELAANADWERLIENALTDDDTLMFVTSGGTYYNPKDVSLPGKPLVLMAKPGLAAKPVLSTAGGQTRVMKFYSSLTMKGLRLKGDGMLSPPDSADDWATPYLVRADDEPDIRQLGTVIFEDCLFEQVRLRAIHMNELNHTDTLIVNNCIFREIGESGVYNSNATAEIDVASITNSTFYKFGQKGVYLKEVGDLTVSNCTFFYSDSTLSGRTGGTGVNAKDDTVAVVRDNIFANLEGTAVKVYGPSPTVEYNMFWEVGANVANVDDATMTFPKFNFDGDPLFKDTSAAALDLALNVNGDAIGAASDESNLGDTTWGTWGFVSVDERGALPIVYALHQNYPNPFNPSTTIKFDVAASGHVNLTVYNILGQEVATLVDQYMEPGFHSMYWNAGRLASGIYFYRIKVNEFVKNQKLVILK